MGWKESRRNRGVLKAFNATLITLISKGEEADTPGKLRLIFPTLISPKQSGFVEGRNILDGIILVQETIHSLKLNKRPSMLIKIDIEKAYDKLSWLYMNSILEAFAFGREWVEWIMNLVSTPLFSIFINGSQKILFHPSWGIR